MNIKVCLRCGGVFETTHSTKKYCTPDCQKKQANIDQWARNGYDVLYRMKRLLAGAKNRAKSKDIPYNIDINFLKSLWDSTDGCCALTGRRFDLSTPRNKLPLDNSPSLDRITPELGYAKGNVRLIVFHMNMALGNYGEDAFRNLVKDYLEGVTR